ncbi:ABC transporter substrate-binding protein [Gryllotalpicola protaetiae]|uniref:Sugar ABC transporter substrate-binding protein n=1 Tax=Gryllotalpicola protaetiae TaxID=2419771 RepID=A0A387BYC2_9MICO|nr:sugar ABC transporter substrate-binding protein [Gryllotalpicola protaetiae]AYG03341.1 sugar ABC transporter substrate-binding protein [Gryllotalpicola protaetiae]
MTRRHLAKAITGVAVAATAALALAGCSGAGAGSAGKSGGTLNVLMVNNPQMVDLQKLTADNFTKQTGIKVNYTVLPEDSLRAKASQEFSSQAGQYDVATISNYEVPFYSKNGWLLSLSDNVAKDAAFKQSDVLKPIQDALTGSDGKIYAEPFYGESSMLYYRADVFKDLGLTMPANPTWDQVAQLADQVKQKEQGMAGICLRGQPGWGQMVAPLTTVVNTMGGTWFDDDWNAQVSGEGFTKALNFYVDLVKKDGESGAPQAGYTECLNDMTQGKAAMWYDATAAAGSLEASDSPVAGKIGYAPAPVDQTESSGWLYSWAWGIEKASKNQANAEKFIEWASGPDYAKLVADKYGWAQVPPGTRTSLYENVDYQKGAAAFYKQVETAIDSAKPNDPGTQKRPAAGIQFVAIPEFANLGTDASQQFSDAIAGKTTVEAAIKSVQAEAQKVGDKYKK